MEKCPKCSKQTLEYNSYLNAAKCLRPACGFEEPIEDEEAYRNQYDTNNDNYDRKKPKWDISLGTRRTSAS